MGQIAQNHSRAWDLEADVLVIGSGAAGLPAAIKAVEAGASVSVVEANYDVGGHAILSGGHMALGGGTSVQKKHGVVDSPDIVFSERLARLPLQRSRVDASLCRSLRADVRVPAGARCAIRRQAAG
jgi:predicted oxidoreductase